MPELKNPQRLAAAGLLLWIVFPLIAMPLNASGTDVHITYNIWATILYLDGGLGLVLGADYINRKRPKAMDLLPIWAILAFGLWAVISALASNHPYAAFFGFTTMKDCVTSYVAYAGFLMLGLVLAEDRKTTINIVRVFLAVSAVMALIAVIDNGFSAAVSINEYTNTPHYQSVFYNTNHYSYYLLINILLSGFMFLRMENKAERAAYAVAFILFTVAITFNDTLGSILGVFLTLVFAVIWSFINKEPKRDKITFAILLAVFIVVSILADTGRELGGSIKLMFSDAGTMFTASSDTNEFARIGSGRGALWRFHWQVMRTFPILGVGPQNVGYSAHNIFLQLGAYTGFIGLALYLSVFVIGAERLIRRRKEITDLQKAAAFIVVGYFICAFFGVSMFYTQPYFYTVLGACLSGALAAPEKGETK